MGRFCKEHNPPLAPSHYELASPESHTAVDFHGFVQLIWLHSTKQKEQEGGREKKITQKKLGYNNPQDLSETTKRRKVQHGAASLGKDATLTPARRSR